MAIHIRKIYDFSLLSGIILMLFALGLISCNNGKAEADQKESSSPRSSSAMNVRAVLIESLPLDQNLSATGTFAANESVEITSEYAGTVRSISFCEGCDVRKGEVLFSLDQRDIHAEIQELNVDIELAQKELERAEKLRGIQAISEEELQQKENRLQALEAERNVLLVKRSKMTVRAPFTGKIGLRRVSPGSYIQPGTVITTLKQTDPIKLEFDVPEQFAHSLGAGDTVFFTSSRSSQSYPAVIYVGGSEIDLTTRTRTFRARAANPSEQLLPGGYADVSYAPSDDKPALLVPAEAIVQEVHGQVVYKVINGRAKKQPVEVGTRTQNAVELTAGVSPGDTVMITGLLNVSDGMPVEVSLRKILQTEE